MKLSGNNGSDKEFLITCNGNYMKRKEFFVVNFLIIIIVIATTVLSFNVLSNEKVSFFLKSFFDKKIQSIVVEDKKIIQENEVIRDGKCSSNPMIALRSGNDIHLRQLEMYQSICQSFAVKKLMVFTAFPYSSQSATEDASFMANKLKMFHDNEIEALVIVEPYVGEDLMEYKDFLAGKYTTYLDSYFSNLKNLGVTDQMMGTWVPFPESNTPNWANKNTEPKDFAFAVNRYLVVMKKYFPNAKGSVLLNATTYEPTDTEWNNGDYLSLIPYLEDVDKNLVDSFGMQGFPWVSKATTKRRQIFRAQEFLQYELAIASAQELRTKDIWLNTGTFYAKYASDPSNRVEVSLNERKGILTGILDVARMIQSYQSDEYRVSINMFSEDKSTFNEMTDWSYFQNDDSKTLLIEFLRRAEVMDIPVSLFDRQLKKRDGISE